MPTVAVDAEGAIKAWVDTVVKGAALTHGAQLQPLRSPVTATYVLISRVGGPVDRNTDWDVPRISAIFHGPTRQAAYLAAVAYLNAIYSLADPTPMGTIAICHGVDVDSGPSELPDPSGHARFYVQASFYLSPA